jgi:hypothetical protein
MTSSCLALPFLPHTTAAPSLAKDGRTPTPLDDGEDKPPRPVRVLDPADPVALELARLYDVLRSTHKAEIEANHAIYSAEEVEHRRSRDDWAEGEWEAHHEGLRPLYEAKRDTAKPRRDAYFALLHAAIAAHGGGAPWASEWYSYGSAHRVVRVGDRVYSVVADYDADWPDNDHLDDGDRVDHGTVELAVIDL